MRRSNFLGDPGTSLNVSLVLYPGFRFPLVHLNVLKKLEIKKVVLVTLESGIDVGQGITVRPGKFVKKNKRRALNKRRACTKCANLCNKKPIKLENFCRPW